jgi:hypothetical protein
MSKVYYELINEIVDLVQDKIDVFRGKWDEFYKWVECCATEIDEWLQNSGYALIRYHGNQFDEKAMNAASEINSLIEKHLANWRTLTNDDSRRERENIIEKCENFSAIKLVDHDQRILSNLELESDLVMGFLFAPDSLVNPSIWCSIGHKSRNMRAPNDGERLLVRYARLSVVHDWDGKLSSTDKNIIWEDPSHLDDRNSKAYKRFPANRFVWNLANELKTIDGQKILQRDLKQVKMDLIPSIQNEITVKKKKHVKRAVKVVLEQSDDKSLINKPKEVLKLTNDKLEEWKEESTKLDSIKTTLARIRKEKSDS